MTRNLIHAALPVLALSLLTGVVCAQDAVEPEDRQHRETLKTPPPPPDLKGTVRVVFQGAAAFSEADLSTAIADQLKEIEEKGLTKARADDAAFFLGNYYRAKGYPEVDVRWEIESTQRLILRITEGPVLIIGNVNYHGNRAVDDATLHEHLLGATRERFPEREAEFPLVEADIQTGVETIRGLYSEQGFLNAVVSEPILRERKNARVDITLNIKEGIKYVWGEISFSGDSILPQAELLICMGECEGRAYTPNQVIKAQRDLQYHYKKHGYFNAVVTAVGHPERARHGQVPVSITIAAGQQYRFGEVTVTGLNRLDADFLPDRYETLRGQTYSPEKSQERFRALMRTGLFKNLRIKEEPLPNGEIRTDLTVEEAKSRELGFSVGYSTYEGGIAGITWRDRNLFGQGRPLNVEVRGGQRGLQGEVLYVDPYLWDELYTSRYRLFGTTRAYDGYEKAEYGFRAELSRKFSDKSELAAFVQARKVTIEDITFSPLLEDKERISQLPISEREVAEDDAIAKIVGPTDYSIVSTGLTQTIDKRDSPLNPTKGFLLSSSVEFAADALGDGVQFFRGSVAVSYYHPMGKGVLALGARGGFIGPLGQTEIPVDERFFNGGSRSVRSFVERELGPRDANGLPIGGETFTTFNVEYTFPIYNGLDFALFYDAGSVGENGSLGTLRHAVGGGLRYKTPVGPLRIDYGVNPSPRDREDPGALHLSIGTSF